MTALAPAPTATFTLEDRDAIIAAIRYLASKCDGAVTRDHEGFDGTDAKRGSYLARLEARRWTDYQIWWGYTRLTKYRRQLEGGGYRTEVTAPAKVDYPTWEERRGVITQSKPAFTREIARTAADFEVRFTYDAAIVADIRTVPGRVYANGVNRIPLTSEKELREFSLRWGFVWKSF